MQTQATNPNRRRNEEAPLSLFAYLLQGSAWLGFLLFLFWMAGLKL